MTDSLVALGILVVISRPLSRWRLGVIGAMCAGLVLVLVLPVSQEFLTLERPRYAPAPPAGHFLGCALGGTLGAAFLARLHARRYPDGAPG